MKPETIRRLGLAAAVLGFTLIVLSAADYLTGANQISSTTTAIGLILTVIGATAERKRTQGPAK